MEYYSATRNKGLIIYDNQIKLEDITPSKISQTEKDKLFDLTYMCNLKKQFHRYRKQIDGCQRWGLGMGEIDEDGQKITKFQLQNK